MLTLSSRVPDLKEIATVAVAVALWNRNNNIPKCTSISRGIEAEWHLFGRNVRYSIKELPVPSPIANYIGTYVTKIETEIHEWVSYHTRAIFFNNYEYDFLFYYHFFCRLIWNPNGTINYKETARNLLSSHRLSNMEKYRFLCTYCLKEEMEKMPLSLFAEGTMDNVEFREYPLIFYWNCYFRNKLRLTLRHENLPSNIAMVEHPEVDNWPSKEYFFDRLSAQEQEQCARLMITQHRVKFQKSLLMKLNESQRIQMYVDHPVEVMTNYALALTSFTFEYDYAIISTWFTVRNLISPDQFVAIFLKYLDSGIFAQEILTQIWIHASADFKSYVLNLKDYAVIKEIWKSCRRVFKLDLFRAILDDADISPNKPIFNWENLEYVCQKLNNMVLNDPVVNTLSVLQLLCIILRRRACQGFRGVICV